MEYVLETYELCKRYGKYTALNGLSMHIPKGAIYGLIGRNGAGKTTLIRLICGLQTPTSGRYSIYSTDSTDVNISKSRRRMGAVVETPSIYLDMTAEDNLKQQCLMLGIPSYDEIPEILRLVGLETTKKKKVRNFSLGMKQRLGIAVALIGSPDFLVLDEPINGLDPQGIVEMRELILKLNHEKQITVLMSSHILDELSRLATHYGFIDDGRLIKETTASQIEAVCTFSKWISKVFSDKKLPMVMASTLPFSISTMPSSPKVSRWAKARSKARFSRWKSASGSVTARWENQVCSISHAAASVRSFNGRVRQSGWESRKRLAKFRLL